MVAKLHNIIRTGLFLSLFAAVAVGQTPTYSIEAVAVNDIPISQGPTNHIGITHGDVITAKIFLRDWSPAGQKLRAYQVKIDDATYASGEQGVVQPVDFQMHPDTDPNAFVDVADPQWVHRGHPTIPLTDTVSLGYRWLSVLLDPNGGPVSDQDGKKFVCGMVKLTPSPNAKGKFTIALVEDAYTSSIISTDNEQVTPIEYERLTIDLQPTTRWRRMLTSEPPDGAVDARNALKPGAAGGPWTSVRLTFNSEADIVTAEDLTVQDGSPNPPRIKKVSTEGSVLTVQFDRPIQAGAWTTITHKNSSTSTRLGRFPGDVNGDGKTDTRDMNALIDTVNGGRKLANYQADIDGDGAIGPGDVLRLLDVMSESRTRERSSGATSSKTAPSRPETP